MNITTDQLWNDYLGAELDREFGHQAATGDSAREARRLIKQALDYLDEKDIRVIDINGEEVADCAVWAPNPESLQVSFHPDLACAPVRDIPVYVYEKRYSIACHAYRRAITLDRLQPWGRITLDAPWRMGDTVSVSRDLATGQWTVHATAPDETGV